MSYKKHGGWNRGLTKETDERVRKNGEHIKDFWTPEMKLKQGLALKGHKGRKFTEEQKKHYGELMRAKRARGEIVNWMCIKDSYYYKKWVKKMGSALHRLKMSESAKYHWENNREKLLQGRDSEYLKKLSVSMKKVFEHPEARLKSSKTSLKNWKDSVYREKTLKAMCKANNKSPNISELVLLEILNKLYPNEWKFVGNGNFWLTYKHKHYNPDFVNCNGKKLIIEFFGEYWHQPTDEIEKREAFASFGYETLIVWGKELKNIPLLEEKIKDWESRGMV